MAILQLIAEEEKSLCFDFLEEKIREESRKLIIMSYFVNTKKSTGLRCISYTACLYSSSLHWKDSYISSGTL